MFRATLMATIIFALFNTSLAVAGTIHVPQDQPTIQAGINAAVDGDTVLVADGTWSGPGNRDLTFGGREIVVRSANGPLWCIIDCRELGRGFDLDEGEGPGAVIHGFQIFRGRGDSGGGIRLSTTTAVTVSGNYFMECVAFGDGGGLACESGSQARVIGNTFYHCTAGGAGGAVHSEQSSPTIAGNFVLNNYGQYGGGISCRGSGSPYIRGNRIFGNYASVYGGGIYSVMSSAPIVHFNEIMGNRGEIGGGGIAFEQPAPYEPNIFLNQIDSNVTSGRGGGVFLDNGATVNINGGSMNDNSCDAAGGGIYIGLDCRALINGTLVAGNTTHTSGGGIAAFQSHSVELNGVTVADNEAYAYGGGLYINDTGVTAENSIIWGNQASVSSSVYVTPFVYLFTSTYCDIQGGWVGDGVIDQNPLFVAGPKDNYYLSQTAAGQSADSPCLDSGDPTYISGNRTTRTDCAPDGGVLDMGHRRWTQCLVAGPGRGYDNPPLVRVYPPSPSAELTCEILAYGAPHYGVNVAVGRVSEWSRASVITGPGPGAIYGPHVRGFDLDGTPLPHLSFLAYGTSKYGVNVATGNLDGVSTDEIITGAGPGAVFGPHVRAFAYVDSSITALPEVSFFAYGTLKYGVNVTAGDIDGDRRDEIITGAGPGAVFGPHVRGWNVDDLTASPMPGVSFLAYGTHRWGVNVGCADIDGDGIEEIITGPGPSNLFGSLVRGWNYDGVILEEIPGCTFFAWAPEQAMFGARVSGADIDYDGRAEIIVGAGPDPSVDTTIKIFSFGWDELVQQFSLRAFPAGWNEGVNAVGGAW